MHHPINRRTLLKAAGVSLALPFLESMNPVSASSSAAVAPPKRMVFVCTTLGLHRVEIAIRPENAASLRIVEKLGFTEIGLAPGYLHIAGSWRDHRVFQLLAEDVSRGVLHRALKTP